MKHVIAMAIVVLGLGVQTAAFAASDPVTALPVFPSATKVSPEPTKSSDACGHSAVITVYRVDNIPLAKVVAWYRHALPGVTPIDGTHADTDETARFSTFLTAGGTTSVVVGQTSYSGVAARAMASLSKRVILGYYRYTPAATVARLTGHERCSKE